MKIKLRMILTRMRSNQSENHGGRLVKDVFAELDMFAVNIDMNCTESLITYMSSRGNSVVDYIFINASMRKDIQHVKVNEEHPCNSSYHLPLIVHIIYDRMYNRPQYPRKSMNALLGINARVRASSRLSKRLYDAIEDIDEIH